jgi:hypothetical protein
MLACPLRLFYAMLIMESDGQTLRFCLFPGTGAVSVRESFHHFLDKSVSAAMGDIVFRNVGGPGRGSNPTGLLVMRKLLKMRNGTIAKNAEKGGN